MHQHLSKLTGTLKQLSEPELEKLAAYLQSPYFEAPTGAFLLFQYLKKLHPHYDEKKTDPAVIEKKAPALGNQKKQANAGSDLLKAIEGFLAIEDFLATPNNRDIHLLQAFKKHHLFEAFNKEQEQLFKQLSNLGEQDFDSFYKRHLVTEIMLNGFDTKLNRTLQNDIFPITKTLDEFYALKKLRYHCELLSRHQVLGTPYYEDNLAYLLDILEPFNNPKYPYVYLFVNVYRMLKTERFEDGEKYYQSLKNFIEQNAESDLPMSVKESINYVINYGLFWNTRGYSNAGVLALWGLEIRTKHGALLEHNKITPSDFRNIVSLSVLNNRPAAGIKQFIDNYALYLPSEQGETNKAFALAQYNYYTKDFDSAMPLFQQAQVKDEPIFNAIVRRWQFMCMYEQNPTNTNLLLDFLDAYEKYLQRNSAALHWLKDTFSKNIVFGRKLIKATDSIKKNDLKEQLNTETYFTGKEWLLQQL